MSAQRGSRSRAPPLFFFTPRTKLTAQLRDGGHAAHPPEPGQPRGCEQGCPRAPGHGRGAAPRPQGFWVTGSLCPSCSVSLIWKTNHKTPTKAGVRPRPTACRNRQFAEETAAALASPRARPHCRSGSPSLNLGVLRYSGIIQAPSPPSLLHPTVKTGERERPKSLSLRSPGPWAATHQQPEPGHPRGVIFSVSPPPWGYLERWQAAPLLHPARAGKSLSGLSVPTPPGRTHSLAGPPPPPTSPGHGKKTGEKREGQGDQGVMGINDGDLGGQWGKRDQRGKGGRGTEWGEQGETGGAGRQGRGNGGRNGKKRRNGEKEFWGDQDETGGTGSKGGGGAKGVPKIWSWADSNGGNPGDPRAVRGLWPCRRAEPPSPLPRSRPCSP